jgi:hypothetical protein
MAARYTLFVAEYDKLVDILHLLLDQSSDEDGPLADLVHIVCWNAHRGV